MFWKKLPLPPLANDERDYWATVKVGLPCPIPFSEQPDQPPEPNAPPVVGYFRNFGLRARGDARGMLERVVTDGLIDWSESELAEVDPGDLDRGLKKLIKLPDEMGVWYMSSKIFFPAEGNSAG